MQKNREELIKELTERRFLEDTLKELSTERLSRLLSAHNESFTGACYALSEALREVFVAIRNEFQKTSETIKQIFRGK